MSIFKSYLTNTVLLLLLLFLLEACTGTNDEEAMATNKIDLSDWEDKMHVVFPENTEVLGMIVSPGRDDAAYLKIKIHIDSWQNFLENSPVQVEDMDDAQRFFLGNDNEQWDPSTPADLPTAQAMLSDGRVINIGADFSNKPYVIVYLMWHEQ